MTRMLSGGISIPKPPILHGRCMMCMVAKIEIFVDFRCEMSRYFSKEISKHHGRGYGRIWLSYSSTTLISSQKSVDSP